MSTVEVSLTVGKLDASLALLTTQDHHVIEFPTVLLPDNVRAGSIITMNVRENIPEEQKQRKTFEEIQQIILEKYGSKKPNPPVLKVINTTQTSCVLSWEQLSLGSAKLKQLILYRQGVRSIIIPNPFKVTSTKISGLSVDTPYEFQLKLITTSGQYWSEKVKVHTHKMTDMSGITVCLGPLDPLLNINETQIEDCLRIIGARNLQKHVAIDTTHFICNDVDNEDDKELIKAKNNNIPIVRPEWIRACAVEKRIVGVRGFYLDADKGILKSYPFPPASSTSPLPTASSGVEEELGSEKELIQTTEDTRESDTENPLANEEPTTKDIVSESSLAEDYNTENVSNDKIEPTEVDVRDSESKDKNLFSENIVNKELVSNDSKDTEPKREEEEEVITDEITSDQTSSKETEENHGTSDEPKEENIVTSEQNATKETEETQNTPDETEEENVTISEQIIIKEVEETQHALDGSDTQNSIDEEIVREEPVSEASTGIVYTTNTYMAQETGINETGSEGTVTEQLSENQLVDEEPRVDNSVIKEEKQQEEGEDECEDECDDSETNDVGTTNINTNKKNDAAISSAKSNSNKKKNKKRKNKKR